MEYVHDLNLIHRDLKYDNLLIVVDKSIKIADFGVACIEVQTEGMTPDMEHSAEWLLSQGSMSDDELVEKFQELAVLVQIFPDILIDKDSLHEAMTKFQGSPCSGLVH